MWPCPIMHLLLQVHPRHSSIIVDLRCTLTSSKCDLKPSPAIIVHLLLQHLLWSVLQAKRGCYNTTPALY